MSKGSLKSRVKANKKWRAKNPHKIWSYRTKEAIKNGVKNSKYYSPYDCSVKEILENRTLLEKVMS